ncbi:MAG: DASH family cryptochrome, partial [Chloroflexota bacterium]
HLHDEPMQEEIDVEDAVRKALPNLDWQVVWGHTLVDLNDLPFEIDRMPDVFTQFRKAVEKGPASDYNRAKPTPKNLPPIPDGIDPGEIPASVEALGLEPLEADNRLDFEIHGGETAGLRRLKHYIWDEDRLRLYKETRNGMLNPNDSSKLSPWLAHGCLSPRRVQGQIARYEAERVKDQNTYWLTFELLWRDFFRLYGTKHGNRIFLRSGPKRVQGMPNRLDEGLFAAWREGRTGLPMVDASMRELNATGFMSNRGRQNVASFFTKHLKQPWWVGAAYYEAMLIDYDVTSNWGNWAYAAGVGSDPRNRYFDVEFQLKRYDQNAEFVKYWCPELRQLQPHHAREPYKLSAGEQKKFGVILGEDYPWPNIDYERITQQLRNASQKDQGKKGSKSTGKNGRPRNQRK